MSTRFMRTMGWVLATALFFGAAVPSAFASPRKTPAARILTGATRFTSLVPTPLESSPFVGYLDGEMGSNYVAEWVHLDAGDQFAVQLTSTQGHISCGLLPPTAGSIFDDFVAWDDGMYLNSAWLHYVAPTSGDYTLLIYCDQGYPVSEPSQFYVTWLTSAGTPKSNAPGPVLPAEGATGTLGALSNWSEVYHVDLAQGQGLSLRADTTDGDGDIDLYVYEPSWTDLYAPWGPNDNPIVAYSTWPAGYQEGVLFRAPTAGSYSAQTWLSGGNPASYRLEYLITDPTTLTAGVSSTAVGYGQLLSIGGLLTEHDAPLTGQVVILKRLIAGTWTTYEFSQTTSSTAYPGGAPVWWTGGPEPFSLGTYLITLHPTTNLQLYVRYPGVIWAHTPADSAELSVMVSASMDTPSSPSSVTHGHTFTISGIVRPQQAAGSACPIVLKIEQRKSNGTYVAYRTVRTRGTSYSGYTRYKATLSLPKTGKFRVRAYHPADPVTDADGNAATYSGYRSFAVK